MQPSPPRDAHLPRWPERMQHEDRAALPGGQARPFVILGAVIALCAVAAGAFGAHGLRGRAAPELLAAFETGARYQMFHALALFAIGWWVDRVPSRLVNVAGWLMVAGTVVFSGSLYAMTLTGARWLGAVTPAGGVLLLLGWACFALAALRTRTGPRPD